MTDLQLTQWLEQLDLGDKDELVVLIKIRSPSERFFYGDARQLREMADRHRKSHWRGHLEYQENDAGPEWLFELLLVDGGIGLAEASLSAVSDIAQMVALAVQADWDGRRAHCDPPEDLDIVVWGFDPKGIFVESPDFTIALYGDTAPEEQKPAGIVIAAIQTIAETRLRQDEVLEDGEPESADGEEADASCDE